MSQINEIEKYIKTHKDGISSKEAFELFGATRLSAIIYNLKHKRGLNIYTKPVTVKNRYGRPTVFFRYILAND